jgi:heavy metal sensor kinase
MALSFKLKMALFSACTSGVIFVAFALLFMTMIRRIGLERIDRHLQTITEAQLRRPPPGEHWARFDSALAAMSGDEQPRQFLVKVLDRDGQPIYTSPRWPTSTTVQTLGLAAFLAQQPQPNPRLPGPPFRPMHPDRRGGEPPFGRPPMRKPRLVTVRIGNQPWRMTVMGTEALTLIVGTDLADFEAELKRHWNTFAVAGPIALLLLATGGWLLAGQALKPVRTLTQVADAITAKGLDKRVQTAGADHEFQALTDVINRMLDRLETSFQQAARFSADAAHELKTPLTILQGQLEQALQRTSATPQEQQSYADLLEEVQRLKGIVRKLLLLAQSDSGQLRLSREPVCLTEELENLFEDFPLLGPGLTLEKNLAPNVRVLADPDLLRQVMQNLFSNAIKYNRASGRIDCALVQEGANAVLTLSNTTDSDTQVDRARLFDRFYRGDRSRNRKIDGTGLGLSLAREISLAHGGNLTAEDAPPGWMTFRLTLPAGL